MLVSQPPPAEAPLVLPPDPATDARLYTYKEVADMCKVKTQTLMEWVKRGKVPSPTYLGGYTARFRRTDVDEILKGPQPANSHTPAQSPRSELQKLTVAGDTPKPETHTPGKCAPSLAKHLDNNDMIIERVFGLKTRKPVNPKRKKKKPAKKTHTKPHQNRRK